MLLYYSQKFFFGQWFKDDLIDIKKFEITHDLDKFLSSDAKFKVSFLFHYEPEPSVDLYHLNKHSNLVFYFADHPNWMKHINLEIFKNVIWVLPGKYVKTYETKNLFWNAWMLGIANVFSTNIGIYNLINDISHDKPKLKYFDCLLGSQRSHRDLVFELIPKELLDDKIVFTYAGHRENPYIYYDKDFQTIDDVLAIHNDLKITNYNYIPKQLYNQTAYTIVTETISEKDLILVSEKIARPILAKRLFIAFSSPGYLNFLKELGFRTFDDVIDETYDSIVDEKERFAAAMEQVVFLCNQDQDRILKQIQPIVEHNFNLITNTDYNKLLAYQINKILDDYSKI
jgi:hypothetical protein